MNETIKVGAVVFSKMGRDSGKYYLVIDKVDDNYVKIADGKLRTLEKPKLKKIKHLRWNGDTLDGIAVKLAEGKQVFNAELVSALRAYNGIKSE